MNDRKGIVCWWNAGPGRRGSGPTGGLLLLLLAHLLAVPPSPAEADPPRAQVPPGDWPGWRGPAGDGTRKEALPVLRWSANGGVLWKVPVPGEGHASPVVVGDKVFVSTADEAGQSRTLLCFDPNTGALRWQTPFHGGAFMNKHAKNSHASPTPACDGRRVYVPYVAGDALWLSALDVGDGHIVWQPRIGPFASEWGYASSPVLYKDLVIVVGDNKGPPDGSGGPADSYLAAVHRQTGEVVWRVPRPLAPSYGTPVVAHLAGRDQLVLCGAGRITSYDPATGNEIWFYRWSSHRSASSVAWGGDCVFASANWPRDEIVCVRADGNGDVTDSHLVWRQGRGATDVPAPLFHDGRLYLVNDRGLASCLDGATGRTVWQKRLGNAFSASPVLAGDRILATGEDGTTHVLGAAPPFDLLASNAVQDPVLASPALVGDRVFLRSRHFLWCLDGQSKAPRLPAAPGSAAGGPGPHDPKGAKLFRNDLRTDAARPAPVPGSGKWLVALVCVSLVTALAMFLGVWLYCRQGRRAAPVSAALPNPARKPTPPATVPVVAFACPGCRKNLRARAALAGRKVKCPHCTRAVLVPLANGVRGPAPGG